jgi:hypothetical protein
MKKSILAAVLSVMLLGVTCAPFGNAYAHQFSKDESAAFLLLVESTKVELGLVQSNLASNVTLAEEHAASAHEHFDEDIIKEISEKNERLGRDLPAALADLRHSVASNTAQQVQTKVQDINDLLDETVTVRIEPEQMTNPTFQAYVMANMLVGISFMGQGHYEIALGIGEEHEHGEGHDDKHETSSSNETDESSSHDNGAMEEAPVEIVDVAHYQTAVALSLRAQELWAELKTSAPPTAAHEISEIDAALPDLVQALNDKASNSDIQVIIHGRIHPNMITAFGLKLAGEHEPKHSTIPKRLIMYAEETGEHIHQEHLAEDAPINDMYSADMRYALTLTGEAASMTHDSMETPDDSKNESMSDDHDSMTEDAEITLKLATWKSTGRVLYLDITGGSITVGEETMTVKAGQAYYIINGRVMFAFAVVMPEGGEEDSMQLLKLKLRAVLPPDSMLPADESDQPLDIISTRIKIGSDWSLETSGQIALS